MGDGFVMALKFHRVQPHFADEHPGLCFPLRYLRSNTV
jgi:hypothetical protein